MGAWELDEIGDRELRALVSATASVLEQHADDDKRLATATRLPRGALARELQDALAVEGLALDADQVQRLLDDDEVARRLALRLLGTLGEAEALVVEVDAELEAQRRLMVVEPVSLAATALLLLVVKLKRVRVGKQGVDVQFYEARSEGLNFVQDLAGS